MNKNTSALKYGIGMIDWFAGIPANGVPKDIEKQVLGAMLFVLYTGIE